MWRVAASNAIPVDGRNAHPSPYVSNTVSRDILYLTHSSGLNRMPLSPLFSRMRTWAICGLSKSTEKFLRVQSLEPVTAIGTITPWNMKSAPEPSMTRHFQSSTAMPTALVSVCHGLIYNKCVQVHLLHGSHIFPGGTAVSRCLLRPICRGSFPWPLKSLKAGCGSRTYAVVRHSVGTSGQNHGKQKSEKKDEKFFIHNFLKFSTKIVKF